MYLTILDNRTDCIIMFKDYLPNAEGKFFPYRPLPFLLNDLFLNLKKKLSGLHQTDPQLLPNILQSIHSMSSTAAKSSTNDPPSWTCCEKQKKSYSGELCFIIDHYPVASVRSWAWVDLKINCQQYFTTWYVPKGSKKRITVEIFLSLSTERLHYHNIDYW